MSKMRRFSGGFLCVMLLAGTMISGCAKQEKTEQQGLKAAYIVAGKLGDQGFNDASYEGIKKFEAEQNIQVTTVEVAEFQDNEINARSFAQEGYDLVILGEVATSDIIPKVAEEYPDTHFVIVEGTVDGYSNVTCLRTRIAEASFLTGAFAALMNEHLTGTKACAYVGGMRNPALDRSQYSFMAGAEYEGAEVSGVYIGNFTDVAKGKEVAMQFYNNGIHVVQAFAGGAGIGVFQAAESMGDTYYAMGSVNGQFELSPSIIASQTKNLTEIIYQACTDFAAGTLKGGVTSLGISDSAVGIKYKPDSTALIPEELVIHMKELEKKIVDKELVPPSNEKEYLEFQAKHLKKQ